MLPGELSDRLWAFAAGTGKVGSNGRNQRLGFTQKHPPAAFTNKQCSMNNLQNWIRGHLKLKIKNRLLVIENPGAECRGNFQIACGHSQQEPGRWDLTAETNGSGSRRNARPRRIK